ncbi:type IV pilus modification PilV family protein [Desulfonema ishimotonii]|nr:type II secretion system protein [Desulfonema ishimotonii]
MNGRPGQGGFTYLTVMIMVVVAGIALNGAARYWQTTMKRAREAELLFRGDRIARGLFAWKKDGGTYPRRLEVLLKDPRVPGIRRYLRKIYPDPMTPDGEWGLITDQAGGIRGVFSKSGERPLKIGNFPPAYATFTGAQKYSAWRFVYVPRSSARTPQPENVQEGEGK